MLAVNDSQEKTQAKQLDSTRFAMLDNELQNLRKMLLEAMLQKSEDSTKRALEPEPGDMLTDPQKVFDKAEEMAARYKQMLLEQAEEGEDPIAVMTI